MLPPQARSLESVLPRRPHLSSTSIHDLLSGRRRDAAARALRALLSAAAPAYRLAVGVRNRAFDRGLLHSTDAEVPVISIGNLTAGGTGKTPTVAWIVDWFQRRGRRPGILSRGYRTLDGAENDEKRLLDQLCPGVLHLQHPRRTESARTAVREYGCDVLVLDDGFQHRRLRRDLDVVLIDALNPWGYGRLLPRGLLREPPSSLARAGLILITRCDAIERTDLVRLRDEISRLSTAPIVESTFAPGRLVSADGRTEELVQVRGQPVAAFCGIGNPDGFRRTLEAAGLSLPADRLRTFPDHHHYSGDDLTRLAEWGRGLGVSALLTTRKDLVKLPGACVGGIPVWGIDIALAPAAGANELERMLREAMQ